ncbi:SHOCT domain-containing protein [Gammaproteobacteria bacterium]|nr:SHOCT domain-containing protein [Gammaproteobacteria bacterium]
MNKSNANKISENIKEQTEVLKNQKEDSEVQNDSQKTETSMADELSKLAQLRDSGVLTEEEFSSQKEKLLNK